MERVLPKDPGAPIAATEASPSRGTPARHSSIPVFFSSPLHPNGLPKSWSDMYDEDEELLQEQTALLPNNNVQDTLPAPGNMTIDGGSVEGATVENASTKDTPVKNAPVEKMLVVEKAPVQKAPIDKASLESRHMDNMPFENVKDAKDAIEDTVEDTVKDTVKDTVEDAIEDIAPPDQTNDMSNNNKEMLEERDILHEAISKPLPDQDVWEDEEKHALSETSAAVTATRGGEKPDLDKVESRAASEASTEDAAVCTGYEPNLKESKPNAKIDLPAKDTKLHSGNMDSARNQPHVARELRIESHDEFPALARKAAPKDKSEEPSQAPVLHLPQSTKQKQPERTPESNSTSTGRVRGCGRGGGYRGRTDSSTVPSRSEQPGTQLGRKSDTAVTPQQVSVPAAYKGKKAIATEKPTTPTTKPVFSSVGKAPVKATPPSKSTMTDKSTCQQAKGKHPGPSPGIINHRMRLDANRVKAKAEAESKSSAPPPTAEPELPAGGSRLTPALESPHKPNWARNRAAKKAEKKKGKKRREVAGTAGEEEEEEGEEGKGVEEHPGKNTESGGDGEGEGVGVGVGVGGGTPASADEIRLTIFPAVAGLVAASAGLLYCWSP